MLANWNVWAHGFAHTLQSSGGADVGEEVWFLAQTPWAVLHGVNPLANNWLNAPAGLNLMDNTTMPLLGLLGSPITLTLGPIATLNVLIGLGFAGSAATFYLMARQFVNWWPAAFFGGLLYGFSPFEVAAGHAHLFMTFALVPPLVVLVVHHFVRAGCRSPWMHGIALGSCYAAQFYISAEAFASLVVMSAVAAVVGGLLLIRRWRTDIRQVVRMGATAVTVAIVCLGYGAWTGLDGPSHINGPAQQAQAITALSSDPAGLVVPTDNQHFSFDAALGDTYVAQRDADWQIVTDLTVENGTYVGLPLLVVLVAGLFLLRRNRLAVFTGIMAAIAMILSMGSYLHVDGHRTSLPLPFIVLSHLPLLESSEASRYATYFWLFAAFLFCLTLARLHESRAGRRRGPAALVCLGVAAFALLPLAPAWPYPAAAATVPVWFTSAGRAVPVGTTVVVYPSASAADSSAMLWQAMADMTFRMPGGYAVFASPPTEVASFNPTPSPLLAALGLCAGGQTPDITPEQTRAALRGWRASSVVVARETAGADCATNLFDQALGAHRAEGGVSIWPVQG